ncbi:uncharacterized protein I303_107968 [Kwoniella dejecticola CBS 10117]|uniref:Autophagy-related protein 13 n=1 Tax=Kwoniella dejecticola CBS 10117 TaxID=1296121 RepID=A0A1A5ZW61_9TREE|nr:uncharacterized protein I303_07961 [Kwoniella dejecticola CBS 10117]OBR82047.1 hypothetical protein I303_07961 [Kwoniella dejecticola CBS 10117]
MSYSPSPLKPYLQHTASSSSRSPKPSVSAAQQSGERNLASSSASLSQIGTGQVSRTDQVLYRFYLKTVGVLVDGRLTHYAGKQAGEKKYDKWFNLILPELAIHKSDLGIYRSISSYQPYTEVGSTPSPESCTIPPLLIAFILDTSDIPNGQALLWNKGGAKIPIDVGLAGKGKGKERETRSGIILERWTFSAQTPPPDAPSTSQLAPHTAYRIGIIHFRALFSLIRLLPAYRLFRRLRRSNNGLRMGLKLWGAEGYQNSPEGLEEAWEVMERGLVGLSTGLDELVVNDSALPEEIERYDFPKLELFGNEYTLSADFRPEVDFSVEDMEAVLSEKFVDMDEDWFTPTVSRRNTQEESPTVRPETSRKSSMPTPIQSNTSPIPSRQAALPAGSYSSSTRPAGSRVPSSQDKRPVPGQWGALAEGLPFAGGSIASQRDTSHEPPSPSMATPAAIVAARRLSGHSIQPFASASPSTSLLRSTPPQAYVGSPIPTSTSARPVMGGSRPASIGRTSSFLSQSGRSFTHAQLANMYAGSASPPVTGAMSGVGVQIPASSPPPGQSPISPSSLSFTKQPVPRSISGRPYYMTPSASSPFIPESLERESSLSSYTGPPGIIKRYSSSLSQRSGRAISGSGGATNTAVGSQGSSVGEGNSPGQGLLRRTSTRESGLRHSLEGPAASVSASSRLPPPDEDDIQAFLKTLDALPQPPSLAAQAIQASRSHLPSTSSSLSAPSIPLTPSPLLTSSGSPGTGGGPAYGGRVPLTKQQIDEELKRMAGSFSVNAPPTFSTGVTSGSAVDSGVSSPARASSGSHPSSIGLLSASRPSSATRRAIPSTMTECDQGGNHRPMYRRQTSGEKSPLGPGSSSASPNSNGLAYKARSPTAKPMTSLKSADELSKHRPQSSASASASASAQASGLTGPGAARSLPGRGTREVIVTDEEPLPNRSTGTAGNSSPQTTGGTMHNESTRSRRGPVLLRGGFGDSASRPSHSHSPSHSPVRDVTQLGKSSGVGLGIRESSSASASPSSGRLVEDPECGQQGSGFRSPYSARRSSGVSGVSISTSANPQQPSQLNINLNSGQGISGYPGLPLGSTGTNTSANPSSGRAIKGQRTAPSSLGGRNTDDSDRIMASASASGGIGGGQQTTRRQRVGSESGITRLSEEDIRSATDRQLDELEEKLMGMGINRKTT